MKVIKCITLQDLKELERIEYESLNRLSLMRYDYEKEGKVELAKSIEGSIKYQRGRWGMLKDLIDENWRVTNE